MHSCPECLQACYCNGDVDDIDSGDTEAASNCVHWQRCDVEDNDALIMDAASTGSPDAN